MRSREVCPMTEQLEPDMSDDDRCVACYEYRDYCPGGHGPACEWCQGWAGAHVWHHSNSGTTTCERCGLLPLDDDDIATGCVMSSMHEPTCEVYHDTGVPWVRFLFSQGKDRDEIIDIIRRGEMQVTSLHALGHIDVGEEPNLERVYEAVPWGASDEVHEHGQWVFTIGPKDQYVSIQKRLDPVHRNHNTVRWVNR